MRNDPWHTLEVGAVEHALGTSVTDGLGTPAVAHRLAEYGANEFAVETVEPWWRLALRQFRDPLIYILIAAAGVTIALRDYSDTAVILIVVVINAVIGFAQEYHAREAMRALGRLSAPHAQVIRDGELRDIASRDLVPGDVVLLTSGSRVPADLRLAHLRDLTVDESVLTGESVPVEKVIAALPDGASTADQINMAFAGTTIVRGRGRGIVVRTGATTELGRIAGSMRAVGQTVTPLQEVFARFGRWVGVVILGLATLVLAVGLIRGLPPAEIFLTAVAIAVSAIPEGLPVVLTVTLAVGVRRMARHHAIIRSLPAVETLGSTTVIGSDKTGTLTRNEMTVRAIWAGGTRYDVTDTGLVRSGDEGSGELTRDAAYPPALLATLRSGVLASETDATVSTADPRGDRPPGDPVEVALHVAAAIAGILPGDLHQRHPEVDLVPFESERGFMVSLRHGGDRFVAHLKGAPEVVIARCDRQLGAAGEEPVDRTRALEVATALAADGLRVLAMAYRDSTIPATARQMLDGGFVFAGLVGMEDPLRPEAMAAVADARTAGIRVLMLTGDHVGTARSIGRRLGLGEDVVDGQAIDRLSDEELDLTLRRVCLYARVTPEHKLRIVQRLKHQGEIVAVTGDGVNDAPALRAAHLGIAMGARGSDVAREAADMVLTDDNFATIVGAIEEGRTVFSNVRKITFFLLSTAAGELLAVLVTLFAGWPLPFTATQILWINVVTDSLQVMALAFDPGDPDLRHRSPRPPGEGVLTKRLVTRLGSIGVVLMVVTLCAFWWTLHMTGSMTEARTVAVTQMVIMQFYHVFNCRSLDRSVFATSPWSNPFLLVSMATVTVAHLAVLYVPWLQRLFGMVPLTGGQWLVILSAGLTVVIGGELDKLLSSYNRRPLS